jgi:hypothetical protein
MEGNLQLAAGSTIGAGYHVSIPSSTAVVYVTNAAVTLYYSCSSNGSPVAGTIVLAFPDETFTGSGWQASGGQQDSLVWQIASQSIADATTTCGGGSIWVNAQTGAAAFSGTVSSSPGGIKVSLQFHYRETTPKSTSGSWSATSSVTTCTAS